MGVRTIEESVKGVTDRASGVSIDKVVEQSFEEAEIIRWDTGFLNLEGTDIGEIEGGNDWRLKQCQR